MTENEALEELKTFPVNCLDFKENQALHVATKALEEIQQYRAYKEIFESHFSKDALELLSDKEEFGKWLERGKWIAKKCDEINRKLESFEAIGTIDEFKALKEKNEPKKIEFMHNRSDIVSVWKCHCGNVFLTKHKEGILDGTDVNYCCKCGQKIDWGDDNE